MFINLYSFFQSIFNVHPWKSSILIIFIIWMVGVRVYNVLALDSGKVRISKTLETFQDLASGETAEDLSQAAYFSALSSLVYVPADQNGNFPNTVTDAACDLSEIINKWDQLELPANLPRMPEGETDTNRMRDGDLVFGVWSRPTSPNTVQIALVFRGTHRIGHFWSNLRWIIRPFNTGWDQYDLTATIAPKLEDYILKLQEDGDPRFSGKKLDFVTAGHSLGGGLAHHAAYATTKFKTVYSFNGTSVTGFYSLNAKVRNSAKKGMRIYRMHERGEVLNLLRWAMSIIYPVVEQNPQIVTVTHNFGKGNFVTQHSIDDLSCELTEAWSLKKDRDT